MKIFVMTDLHGQGELFDKALQWMEEVSEGKFICYFLGDAIDRGPDGWRIMNYLLDNPDKFVYIKGNHEDLFVSAMKEYFQMCEEEGYSPEEFAKRNNWCGGEVMFGGSDMMLHYRNGGEPTFTSWMRAGCPRKYIKLLSELPVFETVAIDSLEGGLLGIYDMCHAGCTMNEWEAEDEEGAIWSRQHFSEAWTLETDGMRHTLIHGHTPIVHMPAKFRKENGMRSMHALNYNHGTKIDLDCACFHYGCLNVMDLGCFADGLEEPFVRFYTAEMEELRENIRKNQEEE